MDFISPARVVLGMKRTARGAEVEPLGEPEWVISAKMATFSGYVGLDTHRQEKVFAGFTCPMCPNPHRSHHGCVCEPLLRPADGFSQYPHGVDRGGPNWACKPRDNLNDAVGCGLPLKHTKRCPPCNSKMKRWTRSKNYENRILTANSIIPETFVAFVTMTIPNIAKEGKTLAKEARGLKQQVAAFRRRQDFEKHVLGGIDVVESTESESEWNLHHHGIWIMEKSWPQRDFEETWGEGIVHIQKVRKPHAVLRYLTAYAAKDPIKGVRCLETFGAVRGGAWSAIEEYAAQAKSSPENADVA